MIVIRRNVQYVLFSTKFGYPRISKKKVGLFTARKKIRTITSSKDMKMWQDHAAFVTRPKRMWVRM